METILENVILKPPATSTVKCNASAAMVRDLKNKCEELKNIISENRVLDIEIDLVNKLIYRNSNRLRLDIGFRYFRNIKRYFKKYKSINFDLTLENFNSCLPESTFGSSFYLPSRQMLQHVLHQLIVLVATLEKISLYSFKSGHLFLERIRIGHSWSMASIFLGTASRINYICKRLSWQCCKLYNIIAPALPNLALSGPSWSQEGFQFPKKLEDALDVENPSKVEFANSSFPSGSSKIFDLVVNEAEEDEDEEIIQFYDGPSQNQDSPSPDNENLVDVKEISFVGGDEDLGVVDTEQCISTPGARKEKKYRKRKSTQDSLHKEIDLENEDGEVELVTVKRSRIKKEQPGSLTEMIEQIDSPVSLSMFVNQNICDANNERHASAKRQVSGIIKMLKKRKSSDLQAKNLVARAKDLLKSALL
ncbi:uncharacterized protein LOC132194245 isoform X2 [Neocloeon triangulifer]|uniref:uncharacterized protein LOC132194245 isoform X2 n=1 Tax=Neocloeon triangulifer TaxID=2078957 RepID=UPI00286EDE73|nr:uncharacterized protein LOC132194245 isoform X2 [Neocloeon triangulifer]